MAGKTARRRNKGELRGAASREPTSVSFTQNIFNAEAYPPEIFNQLAEPEKAWLKERAETEQRTRHEWAFGEQRNRHEFSMAELAVSERVIKTGQYCTTIIAAAFIASGGLLVSGGNSISGFVTMGFGIAAILLAGFYGKATHQAAQEKQSESKGKKE